MISPSTADLKVVVTPPPELEISPELEEFISVKGLNLCFFS
jgi:hypothetical protein